ncbi:MAG: hypothetical protein HQL97_12120 [Magnetococcales bacterium]|nr:hypothetical protein [Magnetococcales bacterium]
MSDIGTTHQWIPWFLDYSNNPEKPRKVPGIPGRPINAHDPHQWLTYNDAKKRSDLVGFVLTDDDPFVCIDLDDCIDASGTYSVLTTSILQLFPDALVELSHSRHGLHIWLRCENISRHACRAPGIELYSSKRFIAIGEMISHPNTQMMSRDYSRELDTFIKVFGLTRVEEPPVMPGRDLGTGPMPEWSGPADDWELLQRMFRADIEFDIKIGNQDLYKGNFEALCKAWPQGDGYDESAADMSLANRLGWYTGYNAERMIRMMDNAPLCQRKKWKENQYYRDRTIQKAISDNIGKGCYNQRTHDNQTRPEVRVINGQLHEVVESAQRKLFKAAGGEIFTRAGCLMRVARLDQTDIEKIEKIGIRPEKGSSIITPINESWLTLALSKTVCFSRFDGRKQEFVPQDPPLNVVRSILANSGNWPFNPLTGIITSPTLRLDGSILDKPGYDIETGLFFDPGNVKFPQIKENPTRDDAEQSLSRIKRVISGFSFVSREDQSVALAAILTGIIRQTLPTAPLFGYSAPKMASGKTLLANTTALIVTGKHAATITHVVDPSEEKKRILSLLMRGCQIALIDNISKPFESDTMCSILSERTFTDRILGESRDVTVDTGCLWLATGNNLSIRGDLTTRVLMCRLDTRTEHPDERRFEIDLHTWIPTNRGEIVIDGLTILRAHHLAGKPRGELPQFARFESWSDSVRAALVWLGESDPCATRRTIEQDDPVRQKLRRILSAWNNFLGDRWITINELCQISKNPFDGSHTDLNNLLLEYFSEHGSVKTDRMGYWARAFQGRIEGGLILEKSEKENKSGVSEWRVRSV